MKEPPALPPERSGSWAKDHCDYLLDSIDAQLSQLQAQGPNVVIKGGGDNGMASLDSTAGSSVAADQGLEVSGGRNAEAPLGEDSFWNEERTWWPLACLPDLECPAGGQSESDSVCTEDFVAKFQEGLVDPWLSSCAQEDALAAGVLLDDPEFLERTIHDQIGSSRLLVGLEASAGPHSTDLESKQVMSRQLKETLKEDLGPVFTGGSGEPLSQSAWNGIRSSESLGWKIPQLSQKCCETYGKTNGIQWHGPVCPEEKFLEIGNCGDSTSLLESQQRREDMDISFEWVRDTWEDSNSSLLVEDLKPSQQLQVPSMTPRMTEAPLRTDRQSCQQKGQSDCPKDVPDIACLCTCQAPQNCVLCTGSQARGGHWWLYPLIACDANRKLKPAVPGLGMTTWVAGASGDAKEPLDSSREGCMRWGSSRAMKALGTRRSDDAPGLIKCELKDPDPAYGGNLGAASRGLNKGNLEHTGGKWVAGIPVKSFDDVTIDSDLDSVRTASVRGHFCRALGCQQASGCTRKLCSPQRSLLRDPGSSDTGSEEEGEDRDGFVMFRRRIHSPKKWTRRQGADPGWNGTKKGAFRSCKDLDRREEKLSPEKVQSHEADVSLCSLLRQKEHVALELKALQEALERSQKEARQLELRMKENREKADEARTDLVLLEYKRDACLRELPKAEEELSGLKRQCSQYGALQAEVSRLGTEREALKTQVHCLEDNLSSLKLQLQKAEQETAGAQSVQLQEVAQVASELEKQIQGLERRISALQKVLSEKELELSRLRKTTSGLEAEKEAQATAMEDLKQQLQELQQRKEMEMTQLREALQHEKHQMMQEVQDSSLQEKKKWQEDTRAALQVQRETLAEQHRRAQIELQDALEKERMSGCALQDKVADLNKRNQELECQISSLQSEKQAAMEELQALLQEEKAEGLRRLQEELEQERMHETEQMKTRLRQMEEDLRCLQAKQSEMSFQGQESHNADLAREVALTCQRLQDLLPKKAGLPSLSWMLHGSPGRLSATRAIQALQELSEETKRYLQDLKREMETQKHHVLHIQEEKEVELRQLQKQLRSESQLALEALKERLVQEHMNDIATLQRNQAEADLMLHRQLQEKDGELRAIRRNMAHWKDKTACKLAHKFKEELDTALEKRLSKDRQTDFCRNLETPELEMRPVIMDRSKHRHHHPVGPALLRSASLTSQPSFGSTSKLLLYLQNHIQEPRVENAGCYRGSLDNLSSFQKDLGNTDMNRKRPMLTLSLLQGKDSREKQEMQGPPNPGPRAVFGPRGQC